MKKLFACMTLGMFVQSSEAPKNTTREAHPTPVKNLFIITIDGFRWQELFTGADSALINDEQYTPDTATMKMLYWSPSPDERRRKLMPFFWNVLGQKGQVYGNRNLNNKVNVANPYSISYPGYNEMFTGSADLSIYSNMKRNNPNVNVLEYLNGIDDFRNKVVAFTSWEVFPFILNEKRNGLSLNSGYQKMNEDSGEQSLLNKVQQDAVYSKTPTRHDELTFVAASEYIRKFKPAIVLLSFGETDEEAHHGRYDLYLEKAAKIDKMIGELWHYVQSTSGYRDNTTFIITTDHGRGKSSRGWANHAFFIKGSSETWLAFIGPNLTPVGEMKIEEQLYEKQLAQTIASLVGENFRGNHVASAIALK